MLRVEYTRPMRTVCDVCVHDLEQISNVYILTYRIKESRKSADIEYKNPTNIENIQTKKLHLKNKKRNLKRYALVIIARCGHKRHS